MYPVFYVTACTHNRKRILNQPIEHESFVEFASRSTQYGVWVGRYVLMPDHLHLFITFGPDSISLSAWMKSLKNAISKCLKSASYPPRHWQKGYFDHLLRSEESYDQKWLYVRDNPVRAGLVKTVEDWPYSGEISRRDL